MSTFHHYLTVMGGLHGHLVVTHAFHHHLPVLRRIHEHWVAGACLSFAFLVVLRSCHSSQIAPDMSNVLRHVKLVWTRRDEVDSQKYFDMQAVPVNDEARRQQEEEKEEEERNWAFAGKLQQAREDLGMTQEVWADHLGVTRAMVINWEQARNKPGFRKMIRIAAETGKPLYFFYKLDRDPETR
jgi:DNA-binding transcriptional regulator YiaG